MSDEPDSGLLSISLEAGVLRDAFRFATLPDNEVKLEFTPERLVIGSMNKSHLATILAEIEAEAFEEYTVSETAVWVDAVPLHQWLGLLSTDAVVHGIFNRDTGDVVFESDGLSYRTRSIATTRSKPDPHAQARTRTDTVTVTGDAFDRSVTLASPFETSLTIGIGPTEGIAELEASSDTDHVFERRHVRETNSDIEPVTAAFDHRYFEDLWSRIPDGRLVSISPHPDDPWIFEVPLGDDRSPVGSVKCLLRSQIRF